MKAHLLFRDRNVDWAAPLVWNEQALRDDLGVDTLLNTMAEGDERVLSSSRAILLSPDSGNIATIGYRQAILKDCLSNESAVRELYRIATDATKVKSHHLGLLRHYPHWVLSDAVDQVRQLIPLLRRLRQIAEAGSGLFKAPGWLAFFEMLEKELGEPYLERMSAAMDGLTLRGTLVLSAALGVGNRATEFRLHKPAEHPWGWWLRFWHWFFPPAPPPNSFSIHPRDEGGHRSLEQLRDEGIATTAISLSQSRDHIRHFFDALRAELAFYVGCINLREQLQSKNETTCFPTVHSIKEKRLNLQGLYDVGLALSVASTVVSNDADADGKGLVLVTGANQGGKSTFLRSVGLAHLMMQAGIFVGAQSFDASLCDGIFTHYKREEDATMTSGKFDEELLRMSAIIDRASTGALILFNESFASTNEREGSEVAQQIVLALLERNIHVVFVTHLYSFALAMHDTLGRQGLFLRAQRDQRGVRNFKLIEGNPLPTSFGEDLYRKVFSDDTSRSRTAQTHELSPQAPMA